VVLAGLAVWFGPNAHRLHTSAAARNTALTDSATTSEVNGQVTSAVNAIFSYDYNDLDKTQQAAQNVLTGQAICQYNSLFKVVREQAPQQKLVVTVTAANSAVELLQGDRARVLVFATQSSVRTSTNQSASAGAMFAVNAVHRDGRWKIENIDTFTGDPSAQGC
jgi:Mce-associated membrane protein